MGNADKPEVDLVDEEGHKEKLEVFEQKEEPIKEEEIIKPRPREEPLPKEKFSKRMLDFYDKKYKQLMIIPALMLLIAIIVIGVQIAQTGSFIHKDVSLKGGVTLTITREEQIDILKLERFLESEFTGNDISVRAIRTGGRQIGTIIAADIDATDEALLDKFTASVEAGIGHSLEPADYGIEMMGSSLGASFFRETFTALIIAFVLMSIVVFIYFRSFVPSFAVILSAVSDIIVTLAIVDLLGMKLSTGGIAGFLMLVGYSVDTDMLLTTRLLKRKEGTVFERTISSVKTGMMMTVTTIGALLVGLIFMESTVVRQIMLIVLIGLLVDIVNTWIQNVGILRYYIEKKLEKK